MIYVAYGVLCGRRHDNDGCTLKRVDGLTRMYPLRSLPRCGSVDTYITIAMDSFVIPMTQSRSTA